MSKIEIAMQLEFVAELFDCLGDVVYCLKDEQGRYLDANQAFADRLGLAGKADIIGRKAEEIFPAELAAVYTQQDERVLQTRQPLRDQLELIAHADGAWGWYLADKFPVTNDEGDVTGVVGISQDLKTPGDADVAFADLKTVVDFIRDHLDQNLKTEELASQVDLSSTQLDRRMRRVFRLSTKQYVMKCRVDRARQLLEQTDTSLPAIALQCGFSDQSAFTRYFGSAVNLTPLAYRKQHAAE